MSATDRGIGSEGLEQGGPSLGNDYSRKDLSIRDAGDALTNPDTASQGSKDKAQNNLNMDTESSRNLSGEDLDDDLQDDELDDDDLASLDDDDDEELDELDKGL